MEGIYIPGRSQMKGRFTGASIQRVLKSIGVRGSKVKKALKVLAEKAELEFWLWSAGSDGSASGRNAYV